MNNLIFRLFSLTFNNQTEPWWHNSNHLGSIFQSVQETEFQDKFNQFGIDGGKRFKSFMSFEQLLQASISWKIKPYILRGISEVGDFSLGLTIRKNAVNIFLKIDGAILEQEAGHYVNELIQFGTSLHTQFKDTALLGSNFHITQLGSGYSRPKPPRKHPRWPVGSLVDFMSKPYFIKQIEDGENLFEQLRTASLPNNRIREEKEDLLIFQWAQEFQDSDQIAAGRSLQETYLSQIMDWPIAAGFNEFGDQQEILWGQQSHPPLTFYTEAVQEGYKAIVQNPDGTIVEPLFIEMADWIATKSLPDQTPLAQLHLITPNRKTALSIRQRAAKIGVTKVLYTDESNMLWNPWPPGQWLE